MRLLQLDRDGSAAIVTLARPERRNALSLETLHALLDTLTIIEHDPEVHAVIVASEGDVFSAGHDLSEMTGRSEAAYAEIFDVCSRVMLKLQELPQPTIAEVQGVATAAGCQLVAACDLAIASKDARFATPGVRIGLFCATPMVPLVRTIGRKRALHMLLSGDFIDAATARKWGLINDCVPADELRQATLTLAAKIGEASPTVVASGKRAFYEQLELSEREAYQHASRLMSRDACAPDAQEGIAAFLEKRRAEWPSGKIKASP